jgi:hypothetical protein
MWKNAQLHYGEDVREAWMRFGNCLRGQFKGKSSVSPDFSGKRKASLISARTVRPVEVASVIHAGTII